jgi:hypothetical protein
MKKELDHAESDVHTSKRVSELANYLLSSRFVRARLDRHKQ